MTSIDVCLTGEEAKPMSALMQAPEGWPQLKDEALYGLQEGSSERLTRFAEGYPSELLPMLPVTFLILSSASSMNRGVSAAARVHADAAEQWQRDQ
jgi:hypothetical protein